MYVITGRSIFSGHGVSLTVREGLIQDVQDCTLPDGAPYLSPGFFDMQVNGYAGYGYSSPELSQDHIEKIAHVLASSGTTRHIPTLVTNSQENMVRILRTIARALDNSPDLAAAIPGVHLEGPYISAEEGSGGRVRTITLAPERKECIKIAPALDISREALEDGIQTLGGAKDEVLAGDRARRPRRPGEIDDQGLPDARRGRGDDHG